MINKVLVSSLCFLFTISYQNVIKVYGPGLQPQNIIMPARYFFINFSTYNENTYTSQLADDVVVEINGKSVKHSHCRVWVNKLDRKDGSLIIRYKLYETCSDLVINIYYRNKHLPESPYKFNGLIHSDQCDCPEQNIYTWLKNYGCAAEYEQINEHLKHFNNVDMKEQVKKIINRYHNPDSTSFCHYVLKNNKIHRDCYGKHIGFNMFSDNILLFLTRRVVLPDMEFVMNLGDWPLVRTDSEPLPMFSWCGSNETIDIVMPTYDITESTLENMGRVTLDTLSVQGKIEQQWSQRESRAIWRGRDSRIERLKLIDIARANPELINATLTNFFFFRDKEAEYGPKQPHISFFKFFDYKYLISIDGTVAAYRMPYLLSGGGLVLKQKSQFFEHFYSQLKEWEHYVPVSHDLSDLKERILWARDHDDEAHQIAVNARRFATEHLMPQNIICYHAVLFLKWSKQIASEITVPKDMTRVRQPEYDCKCETKEERNKNTREEL